MKHRNKKSFIKKNLKTDVYKPILNPQHEFYSSEKQHN